MIPCKYFPPDLSFIGNNYGFSEVVFMIFIADKNKKPSSIDLSSVKSGRIVISLLAVETFGFADAFDAAVVIQNNIKQILKPSIKIKLLTYSENLFNVIILNASTTERRLMMGIQEALGAYNQGLIDDVVWVRRLYNLVDAINTAGMFLQLLHMTETGNIHY